MNNVRNALERAVWLYERYGLIAGTIEGDPMAAGKWINAAREALAQSEATDIRKALEALRRADQFITNGIALGFIRMPDADVPDTAHQTPQIIREAIAALAQPQAAQPAPVAWIDPADFAEMHSKENRGLAHNWTLPAERIGRCTMPLYATPPQPAPQAEPALLVRDVAEIMGMDSVVPICKALVDLGYPPRSVNMVIAPDEAVAVAKHLAELAAAPEPFQARMMAWLLACFGPEISGDKVERNHRFLEEALELVQACGCTADEAHQLVDYTYSRPVGEARQEVGGVVTTLSALCSAQGIDMHDAAEAELARIWTKIDVIRAKQAAKPKHSPLPMAGGES